MITKLEPCEYTRVTSTYGFRKVGNQFEVVTYGRAGHPGHRKYASEAAIRQMIADSVESDRQADEDDARYSAKYKY